MDAYDVIVVGAGPAGSAAARAAALGGARTLLLERRREVGTPVQCGEFLPETAELRRMFPRVEGLEETFAGASGYVCARTDSLRVFSPGGRRYEVPLRGVVLDRARFDRSLAEAAVGAGAELRTGCKVTGLRDGCVETTLGPARARVVVGADGPGSLVAREAGFGPQSNVAFGVQYLARLAGLDPRAVEMHFGSVAPGGYAWVIPKGDGMANVGLGVRAGGPRARLRCVLDGFVASLEKRTGHRAELVGFTAGAIPVGGPRARTVRGDVLLAGDAAGHLMPCNGGGIATAMICGRIAGEVAAEHAGRGAPLSAYEERWRREVGDELSRAVATRRVFDLVTLSRRATEVAMDIAGPRAMRDLMTCRPWYRAGILA